MKLREIATYLIGPAAAAVVVVIASHFVHGHDVALIAVGCLAYLIGYVDGSFDEAA